ncbi:MAG: AraC family transcriptional regulator [Clostridia bacterium]|nr:AraC family transcriptional regulator [Clostridia bacterium]
MDWIKGLQRSIDYIEEHLDEEIDYEKVAKESFSSSYHFQRIFALLCGYTLGEYIRLRRLTLAGAELSNGKAKVLDVALKYGYESPDSFAKAFQRFHGITPSQARIDGKMLKSFSPLSIKISLEGGTIMNYRIETKPKMTLVGYKRRFEGTPYDSLRYEQEEKLFISTRAHQWLLKGMAKDKLSDYCVLTNMDDDGYDFYISVTTDKFERDNLYNKDVTGIDFMDKFNFEVIDIPERTYVVFETDKQRMPVPEYFSLRKQIATEWVVNGEYEIANAPELAVYHWGIVGGYENRTIEIWIPVEKN